MKNTYCGTFGFLAGLIMASAITVFSQGLLIVKSERANIREQPLAGGRVVATARRGEELHSTAVSGLWFFVNKGSVRGWIHRSTVRIIAEEEEDRKQRKAVDYWNSVLAKEEKKKTKAIDYLNRRLEEQRTRNTTDFSTVYEDEWIKYASTANGLHETNPARASRQGSKVTGWTRLIDPKDQAVMSMVQEQVDCVAKTSRVLTFVEYHTYFGLAGETKRRIELEPRAIFTPEASMHPIIPQSVGERHMKVLCDLRR